jgi:hypothetical protein
VEQHARRAGGRAFDLPSLGLHVAMALLVIAGVLMFYGSLHSIHQDLAASALSGRLAITLGNAFGDYSVYFPPAERAWFSIAARLGELTGSELDLVVVAMSGVAVLISAEFAYGIRRATVGASPWFLVGSVALLVILPILFKNVFGLREHMVALGLWPYLVLRVSDPDGTRIGQRVRFLVGGWLGLTLLFKYLFSIVVLLVELADAAVQRRPRLLFRIENLVAGAIVALYLFCWLVLNPEQREAIGAVVSAIDANLADPRTNLLQAANQLFLALFFLIAWRLFKLPVRDAAIGLALVAGAVITAWIQERWYSHHLFAIVLAYIAWAWMAGRRLPLWSHAAVALYLLVPISREYRETASYQMAVDELEGALTKSGLSVAGKRVGILTMHPSPYNQVLASHGALRWNSSANNSYVASELKSFDKKENAGVSPPPVTLHDPGRRMLHGEMLRLWEDMPPEVLILDHSHRWPLRYIDVEWLHVFSKDERFKAVLRGYRLVMTHDGERLEFAYYVRNDRGHNRPVRLAP